MTPTTDDHGWWLNALYGVIAFLWLALLTAYGILFHNLATKEWVKDRMYEERENDHKRDRSLFTDLMAPVLAEIAIMKGEQAQRHRENQEKLDQILDNQVLGTYPRKHPL